MSRILLFLLTVCCNLIFYQTPSFTKKDPIELGAQWIRASDFEIRTLIMRNEFTVNKGLKSARAIFTSVGSIELYLNNHKISDEFLFPDPTQ